MQFKNKLTIAGHTRSEVAVAGFYASAIRITGKNLPEWVRKT
jgi:hypothetical protein